MEGTGRWCNSSRMGVTCWSLLAPPSICAAEFCISWSFCATSRGNLHLHTAHFPYLPKPLSLCVTVLLNPHCSSTWFCWTHREKGLGIIAKGSFQHSSLQPCPPTSYHPRQNNYSFIIHYPHQQETLNLIITQAKGRAGIKCSPSNIHWPFLPVFCTHTHKIFAIAVSSTSIFLREKPLEMLFLPKKHSSSWLQKPKLASCC